MTRKKTGRALLPTIGPERRFVQLDGTQAETREDGTTRFSGHAAVFGSPTYIGEKPWGFYESVSRGAFTKTIKEADVRFLHNHDVNLALARSTVGTGPGSMRLSEDDNGLLAEAEWIDTTYARDLATQLRAGVITQMSFSFRPVKEAWGKNDDGDEMRELQEVALFDVSTVTFPAYNDTDAALRSFGADLLMESLELPDDQRVRLVAAIRSGVVSPDLAPSLRAAVEALSELAQKFEPVDATQAQDDDTARKSQLIKMRHRALAAMSAQYKE